jgi:glutathione-regulated potassium-efflux system protein KefB
MEAGSGAEATALLLRDGVIMLGAAMFFVMLFRRFGLGAVLGYLVAGALVGPDGLALVGAAEEMMHIADFGIVLLLFLVGLELHPARLLRLRNDILGLGMLQVVIAGLAITGLIYMVADFSLAASLAIGLPLALSSTAQVLPSLRADGTINTRPGERAFSILLFQDLSIVPLITIIAALSRAPIDPATPTGGQLALYTVGAIVGLVAVGRFLINPLFRLVGRIAERELFVVAGLFIVLASAAVMEALHLSTALGAFIAGVMLADSPYRHELEADIDPFRSILLGLFFISVGMLLDLDAIREQPLFVVGMAVALIAVKATVLYVIARAFRIPNRQALKLGLLLSQGGEFAFVLFAAAQSAVLIAPEAATLFSAVVTVSMASTPFLMKLNDWLDRRNAARSGDHLEGPEHSAPSTAIVIGYGRFGQTVAQMLMAKGIGVTLIDSKPSQIETAGSFGMKVYYGDGTRLDLLRLAGAGDAQALLFCIDGNTLTKQKLEPILETFPQAAIFVRAFDRVHLMELSDLDLHCRVREVFESAVAMGREALALYCHEPEEVARVEHEYRERDRERLDSQSASGDLHAGKASIFGPDNQLADAPAGEGEGPAPASEPVPSSLPEPR